MSCVDVVVVTHDHAATLAATLASLAAQTHPVGRVLVIDNASADASARVASGFAEALPLVALAWKENRGFSAAFNDAVRRSRAPWILSLNPDCRLAGDYIARLVAAGERDGSIGAMTGLLLRARGENLEATGEIDSAGMVVTASGRHLDRGAGHPPRDEHQRPAWVFGASGAAALYRRAALDDVAYGEGEVLDEGFFAYREDADLAWRLQRRGWGCLYLPQAQAFHARGLKPEVRRRHHAAIGYHSVRNRFLLRLSNADWRWHLACFPFWLVRDALVIAACLSVERTSLGALGEAWRLRRKQAQRGRVNARRARVSGWRMVRWFRPGGRVRGIAA